MPRKQSLERGPMSAICFASLFGDLKRRHASPAVSRFCDGDVAGICECRGLLREIRVTDAQGFAHECEVSILCMSEERHEGEPFRGVNHGVETKVHASLALTRAAARS